MNKNKKTQKKKRNSINEGYVLGFDVGVIKKGFHIAVCDVSTQEIACAFQVQEFEELSSILMALPGQCRAMAIDSPPSAKIRGPLTRSAERALAKRGYRIQWTRRFHEPPGWMKNGERLWKHLKRIYRDVPIIETFPTAIADSLRKTSIQLKLYCLEGKERRKTYQDYLDASLCAVAAYHFLQKETIMLGEDDELGPIHIMNPE